MFSLNVDGLEKKLKDKSFIDLVNKHDIICLLETFIIEITNYLSFFKDCDYFFKPAIKLSEKGRPSGGVIVLVKKNVSDLLHIEHIAHNFNNIICLKMNFSNISTQINDTFFISAYLPPQGSAFYQFSSIEHGFCQLEDFLSYLYSNYANFEIILSGDLNARIKDIQPVSECDYLTRFIDNTSLLDHTDYVNRKSKDLVLNTYGKYLYELCHNYDLYILNGFCKSDLVGNFTFTSPNGQSVIDYFIVTQNILQCDIDLTIIADATSWHLPLMFTLDFSCFYKNELHSICNVEVVQRIVWDDTLCSEYLSNVNKLLNDDVIASLTNDVFSNVNNVVSSLSCALLESADFMNRTFYNRSNVLLTRKSWYDNDCLTMKRCVNKLLRKFLTEPSTNNRQQYVNKRNEYNSFLRFKKYMFSVDKLSNISHLSNKQPRLFWSEIRSILGTGKKSINNNIDPLQWFTHFKNVFQFDSPLPSICNENIVLYVNSEQELNILNSPILVDDVLNAINSLKQCKSPGDDSVLNEMLISSKDNIYTLLTSIFSFLFSNNVFIDEWQKTIIAPVFKKGNSNLCCNYRPISLTSLLSKVYTSILNKRLSIYVDNLNILPEEQAAFRSNFSTVDHIFTLYSLVKKQFYQNRKLYVAFIDYKKCFDSVRREALFNVLQRYGINGNFLNALKSIYSNVFSAVKCNGKLTEFFECPIGLKQGCVLSPLLFNIFISEVSRSINLEGLHGLQLVPNENILNHLFYADDNCIFSTTPRGLQSKLNIIHSMSQRLGLEVNLDKTKIIVFRKGGFLGKNEKWFYDNQPVEVVNEYNYLGITFSTKMSFANASLPLIAKAKKCINDILFSLRSLSCTDLNLFTKLFDSKVFPTLSYGCELWGIFSIEDIERVHMYALKRFLNVSLHCSNNIVYSETGRYPLSINHNLRSVKYWLKIKHYPMNRFVRQSYECLLNLSLKGDRNWVSSIQELLCVNGYGYVWLAGEVGNKALFFTRLKQTLIDNFIQNWNFKMSNDVKCSFYYGFKPIIERETYLTNVNLKLYLRNVLLKFRIGVSEINSHRHKFSKNEMLRQCPFCVRYCTENETHVLFICPLYDNLRLRYFNHIEPEILNRPIIFQSFMSTQWYIISKYLFEVFTLRKTVLSSRNT